MNQKLHRKSQQGEREHSNMLQTILEELRLLRKEVMILLPQEDLEDYANPDRIKHSYQRAIKKYPPVSL